MGEYQAEDGQTVFEKTKEDIVKMVESQDESQPPPLVPQTRRDENENPAEVEDDSNLTPTERLLKRRMVSSSAPARRTRQRVSAPTPAPTLSAIQIEFHAFENMEVRKECHLNVFSLLNFPF